MNREQKKQAMAMFILLMFFGSTFAFAMMYVWPEEAGQKYIFDEPLSESDEATFFQQNMVVARVYYDEPSPTIDILASLINTLNQKMILERINVNEYPEIYDYVKDKFSSTIMPMILLRGNTEIYLNGEQIEDDLKEQICSIYFEEIDECVTS